MVNPALIPRQLAELGSQVQQQELEQTPRQICDCCDLDVQFCGKAAEARQRQEDQAHRRYLIRLGWFRSSYPGSCDQCHEPFKPGTLIHANGRGGMRWIAICCAPEIPEGSRDGSTS